MKRLWHSGFLVFPCFVLWLCLAAGSLRAQYVVGKVVFTGQGAYPEPDLQALIGVQPGDALTKAGLQAAAQKLVNTGYFDGVQATVDGPFKSVEARFTLVPIDAAKLVHAAFENFVWLSPEEIATFKKDVPLLALGIPEAGTQQGDVQTAIEKALAARGVKATVSRELVEPSTGHTRRVFEYRVEAPAVRLGKVSLRGVGAEFAGPMSEALSKAQGGEYNEGEAGHSTAQELLMPLLDAGYLDVRLENMERTVMSSSTDRKVLVELKANVVEGAPYRVSAVTFAGTPVETRDAFLKTNRLRVGALASRRDLLTTLQPVTAAYHSLGYMDAVVDATPEKDAESHQVAYTVTVVPGEQYHLKTITVKGLPAATKADFDYAFTLHPGDVYDETYVGTFLIHNGDSPSLSGYGGAFKAAADPNTHLLDLTIEFQAMGMKKQ